MSDVNQKDASKQPGGYAGGKASAERPEEDRRASQKAAETRRQNMVGPGAPASTNQSQSYEAELKGAQWQVEREGNKDVQQEMKAGDQEADKINEYRDKQDADYNPAAAEEEEES